MSSGGDGVERSPIQQAAFQRTPSVADASELNYAASVEKQFTPISGRQLPGRRNLLPANRPQSASAGK